MKGLFRVDFGSSWTELCLKNSLILMWISSQADTTVIIASYYIVWKIQSSI